jgi:hypothetical protein
MTINKSITRRRIIIRYDVDCFFFSPRSARTLFVAGPCFTAALARRRTALSMASSDSLQDFQRVELEAVNEERRRQHDVSVGSTRIYNGADE